MGKEKILLAGIISYMRLCPLALASISLSFAAFAAGCAASRMDHFAGLLVPEAGTCDPPSRAELTLNGSRVLFTPREGIISLEGVIAADGAIRAGAMSNGMDHAPYRQAFVGNLTGRLVIGTFTTPRCRYIANLTATSS